AANVLELGGGDLVVRSGRNIDAGIYYLESGTGILEAGADITTNSTRSPSLGLIGNLNNPDSFRLDPLTWLPTTLFVGKSSFDVSARGDLLLGPVTNPFLLPQSVNNRFYYKTYFSTFGADSGVNISSLGGDVTLRNSVTLPTSSSPQNILEAWSVTQQEFRVSGGTDRASFYQPWLRLAETSVVPFRTLYSLQAPTVTASALDGDINLQGSLTLYPSPTGQLELVAAGGVNGLQPTGISDTRFIGQSVYVWSSASVNVSDANPSSVPSPLSPFSYFGITGSASTLNSLTSSGFL
ncbi:MAG: hypothetical protein KDL87_19175, partial [Verrucomicrobiae bacterium]|nr:hypothetical protein [Verrucomicrobiae bacterium]